MASVQKDLEADEALYRTSLIAFFRGFMSFMLSVINGVINIANNVNNNLNNRNNNNNDNDNNQVSSDWSSVLKCLGNRITAALFKNYFLQQLFHTYV